MNGPSALLFNILPNGRLTGIANCATKVPITPECSLLPILVGQFGLMAIPEAFRRFLFQPSDNGNWRESRLAFHQTMKVILIHFQGLKGEVRLLGNLLKDLLHLCSISEQEPFPVLTHKDQVIEEEKLGMGR
jgi:hypothetical protein